MYEGIVCISKGSFITAFLKRNVSLCPLSEVYRDKDVYRSYVNTKITTYFSSRLRICFIVV